MPMNHNQLIANAARTSLAPLGGVRKGRSRTWLLDRGWRLSVVEFQPGRSKGTYLNVGAHFLWYPKGHVSFDLGNRESSFVSADSGDFAQELEKLAGRAAERVRSLDKDLATVADVPAAFPERSSGWPGFHRGIALGLSGDPVGARRSLESISAVDDDTPDWLRRLVEEGQRLSEALHDSDRFRSEVGEHVAEQRRRLGLGEWDGLQWAAS